MFVILAYDVNVDRVGKVLKISRKYLNHVQNSLFEGELSLAQFKALRHELLETIHESQDVIKFYILRSTRYLTVEQYGEPAREIGDFI